MRKSKGTVSGIDWHSHFLAGMVVAFSLTFGLCGSATAAADGFRQLETSLRRNYIQAQQESGSDSPATANALVFLAKHVGQDSSRMREVLSLVEQLEQTNSRVFGANHEEVAFALQWQGAILLSLDDSAEALRRLERSLAIYEQGGERNKHWVAIVLSRIGTARMNLGELQGTLDATTRALSLSESLYPNDGYRLGIAYNNQGLALKNLGVYAQSLQHFEKALAIAGKDLGERDPRVTPIMGNLGNAYLALGDVSSAEAMFERRLRLVEQRQDADVSEMIIALNDLGLLYLEKGEYALATEMYERGLKLTHQSHGSENSTAATLLNNLAVAHARLHNHAEAVRLHEEALSLHEQMGGADSISVALTLTNLAIARTDGGLDVSLSLPLLVRAIQIYAAADRREGLWQTQNTLRQAYQRLGKTDLAVLWGKEAINTLQSLRAELSSLPGRMQASFVANKADVYHQLADLLISEGRIEEAQQVMQALKEFELFESLDQRAGIPSRFNTLPLSEFEQRAYRQFADLRHELVALGTERRQLEARQHSGRLSPAEKGRLAEIVKGRLPDVEKAMSNFLSLLEKELVSRKETDRRTTDSSRLRIAVEALSLSEPQAKAIGLQYVVASDRLSIILTAPGVPPVARQIAMDRAKLRRQVGELQLLLANPASDRARVEAALVALHGVLFGPPFLSEIRQTGARTLMLSPDDVLRYVPFAALTDGQRYLIEDFVFSVYNEAATDMLLATKAPLASRVAAFGMSQAVDGMPALKAVPSELQSVVRQENTTGTIWLDKAFDRPRFQGNLNSGFNVLHVASHFVLKSGRPDLSSLILGDGSRLSLADISRDDLRFDAFDLVALSACQTAIGGGFDVTGREVESLGARIQQQGAHAVLATLWRVGDGSTSEFIKHFYRARNSGRLNAAEALREAQLWFISTDREASKQGYSAPYFWAPFVLMGNWR